MKKVLPTLALSFIFTASLISQENSLIKQEQTSKDSFSLQNLPIELKEEIAAFFINDIFSIYKSKAENSKNNRSKKLQKRISSLKSMSLISKNFSTVINKKFIGIILRRAGKEKLVELFKAAYKKNEFKFVNFLLLANNENYKTVQASDVFGKSLEDMLVSNVLIGQNDIISDEHIQQIKIFLKMGANVNTPISSIDDKYNRFNGQSILHLIAGIEDCNIRWNYQFSAYDFPSCNRFSEALYMDDIIPIPNRVKVSRKKGPNLEILIKEVLNAGANINDQDTDTGNTALHIAIEHNRKKVANILLEFGADFTIKNRSGMTAFDIAIKRGYFPLLYRVKK